MNKLPSNPRRKSYGDSYYFSKYTFKIISRSFSRTSENLPGTVLNAIFFKHSFRESSIRPMQMFNFLHVTSSSIYFFRNSSIKAYRNTSEESYRKSSTNFSRHCFEDSLKEIKNFFRYIEVCIHQRSDSD